MVPVESNRTVSPRTGSGCRRGPRPIVRNSPLGDLPRFSAIVLLLVCVLSCRCSPASTQKEMLVVESSAATPLPKLVDITSSTRIHFEHLSSPEQKYIVESMGGGVALIDYDGDGWLDIYFTNARSVDMALAGRMARSVLYRNNHDGTFTDVTDKAGIGYPCWAMGAVVGDYNNDGHPDLLVTCFGGVVLYRNNGDGTFTDVTKEAGLGRDSEWAAGAAFGDYDGDGWVDLFVSHYLDFQLKDLPTFGSAKTCKYRGIDVQCGPRGLKGAPDNLYHNNKNGTFSDVSKTAGVDDPQHFFGLSAVWSDFSANGRLDLLVANDSQPNYLYRNNGNGTFTDSAYDSGVAVSEDGAEQANMGVALGDYLHTGRMSIFISHFDNDYATLFRNDGKMSFTDVSDVAGVARSTRSYVGWGDAFFDFDNDGWLDIFLVNGHVYPQVDTNRSEVTYREPKLLFLNQRDGTFKDASKLCGPALQTRQVSRGLAVGDLFNEGKVDLVVENLTGEPMILRPEGGAANHWISFELEGAASNRLALNARVRATAGDLTQLGEVLSGGSYLSQNDLRIHFGLGNQDRVDKAEILWPDGTKQTLNNLDADRFYRIREDKAILSVKTVQEMKMSKQ